MNCLIIEKKFKVENKQLWIEMLNKFEEDNFIKELKTSINSTKYWLINFNHFICLFFLFLLLSLNSLCQLFVYFVLIIKEIF